MQTADLQALKQQLKGEFYTDEATKLVYATDASAYREIPLAVAIPACNEDIETLIHFAQKHKTSLVPRTAGTSLAGQVVGKGIIADMSKYFTDIIELNIEEKWVRLQPGVVRDNLNIFLKPFNLYFGPETSTANRAMIGGMVGNNACGSNSVVYKSTREHLLAAKGFLSDGSFVAFKALDLETFHQKCELPSLEGKIYHQIRTLLSNETNQNNIRKEFPKKSINRRNTGYAIDILLESAPFTAGGADFNFCNLIAGSEGTLCFLTEIKLNLSPLPPPEVGLLCVHFNSIDEALKANIIAMDFNPSASELIDHYILECTKENIEQAKNRFFVQGDPAAILVVEFTAQEKDTLFIKAKELEQALRKAGLGYHFPLLTGADTKKIWTLRKAGLGLLSNLPGDEKAVPVIEDTAVDIQDLPNYIQDFNDTLKQHNLYAVHYAHAGSGELHLRPILNLKTKAGHQLFRKIAEEVALLVKKYNGSLSGEHGDGRLRGEFIPWMIGAENYQLLKKIKYTWDEKNIFNPNKIVDTPPMDTMLRYEADQAVPAIKTYFRFSPQTYLQAVEQCNGSGDCRKTPLAGGTMCPSYMATRNEKDTTRARANILREFLTHSKKENPFNHPEIYDVLRLCLSCKACKSECPSNVDMTKLKAEFLQHYYLSNGVPFRTQLIANFTQSAALNSKLPGLYNFLVTNNTASRWIKKIVGFSTKRSLPTLSAPTLKKWFKQYRKTQPAPKNPIKKVFLFADEFTNYNDAAIGIKTVLLLEKLHYEVVIPPQLESGRTWLSKGLLIKAKTIINKNIELLSNLVSENTPLIGVEPSAILCFRDEYPDLATDENLDKAKHLAKTSFLIDEFIALEMAAGNIHPHQFTNETKEISLHGHCQQKAVGNIGATLQALSLPANYTVTLIPSGCCGMAGSFGYEKENYTVSMQVGELVLFPTVRNLNDKILVAAPGTSCRHQIKDGTGKISFHPAEILYDALKKA